MMGICTSGFPCCYMEWQVLMLSLGCSAGRESFGPLFRRRPDGRLQWKRMIGLAAGAIFTDVTGGTYKPRDHRWHLGCILPKSASNDRADRAATPSAPPASCSRPAATLRPTATTRRPCRRSRPCCGRCGRRSTARARSWRGCRRRSESPRFLESNALQDSSGCSVGIDSES